MPEDNRMPDEPDLRTDQSADNESAAAARYEGSGTGDDESFSKLLMLPFTEARAQALAEFDRKFLSAALARHNGNIARTARALGLHRQSLQKLMARRGLKSVRISAVGAGTES